MKEMKAAGLAARLAMLAAMVLLVAVLACGDTTTTSSTTTTASTATTVGFTTITLGSTTTVAIGSTTTSTYDPNAPPFIDATIPERYNSVSLDIPLRTKPLSSVQVYVNDLLQRQKAVDSTGYFVFTGIKLIANTENKIRIQATDSMQRSATKEFKVYVDAVPPTVTMAEIPKYLLSNSLALNGTVSEDVKLTVWLSYAGQESYVGLTADIKKGAFSQQVSLGKGEGDYGVIAEFNDTGGNVVRKSGTTELDASPPELTIEPALAQLSPSYTDKVRITGKTDPGALVVVFVNGKSTMKDSYSTTIVSLLQKIGRLVKGETEYSTTASSDGSFQIDVQLTQEVVVESQDSITIKRPSGSGYVEEVRYSTGNQWKNTVQIVSIDNVGLQSQVASADILYAYCGAGGDWNIMLENPSPSVLQPILLKDGKASIGFNYRLTWQGPGSDTQAKIVGQPVIRKFSQLNAQESKEYDNSLIPEGRILTQFNSQAKVGSVAINLMQWPLTEEELTKKTSLKFFLEMEVEYSFDYYGYQATGRQRKCIPVEIYLDSSASQAMLPEGFLKTAVSGLNTTIDVLDKVLDVVSDVRKYAFYGCLASHAYTLYYEVSEKMACMPYVKSVTPFTPPIPDGGPYDVEQLCANEKDDDAKKNCQDCWNAKVATWKADRASQWICDRTYCPSVPSVEEYATEQKDAKTKLSYYFEGDKALIKKGSNCWDYQGQKSSYATPTAGSSDVDACGKEYKYQWDSGCIGVDEYAKSFSETYDTNFFNKFVDTVSDICTSGDSDQYVKAVQVNSQLTGTQQYLLVKTGTGTANDPAAGKSLKRVGQDRIDFTYDFKTGKAKKVIKENEIEVGLVDVTELYKTGYELYNMSNKLHGKPPAYQEWRANFLSTTDVPDKLQKALTEINNLPDTSKYDTMYQCNNKIDDDKDGLTDWCSSPTASGCDPDCLSAYDDNEGPHRIASTESNPYEAGTAAAQMHCTAQGASKQIDDAKAECDKLSANFKTYKDGPEKALETCKNNVDIKCKAIQAGKAQANPVTTEATAKKQLDQEKLVSEIYELVKMDVFEQMFQKKWVVDPTSGILRSAQCVCVPAFEQYIKLYRNIADATKKCFNQVLMGADTTAGFCKSVMTQYVCDLVYSAIKCVGKFAQASVNAGTATAHDDSGFGFGKFFAALADGGESVGKSIEGRYGATSMYKVMFQEQGMMNSACVWAFGGDWNVELDQLFARATSKMPTESMVYIFPATRRYMSTNIVSGLPTYIYHIGVGIVAGADISYQIQLVCSADTTCATEDGYANGECDCYRKGQESIRLLKAPGGMKNSDMWSYDFYEEVNNAAVRYDKIRIKYEYINNQNEKVSKQQEMRVGEIGGGAPIDCQFDIGSLMFVCRLNVGQKGYAKFTQVPVLQNTQYMIGDTIKLKGKLTKVSPADSPNTPMYLVANVYDEDGKLIGGKSDGYMLTADREYDLEKDAEFGVSGVPGFTITSANFYSKGVQSTYTGQYGMVAKVDGRLTREVQLSFSKSSDKTTYRINVATAGAVVQPPECTKTDCTYQPNMQIIVDGARITVTGGIGTQQTADTITITPTVGGEANWKVEVGLHYASEDDQMKYETDPINVDGEQQYSLSFKVIGSLSPTAGQCDTKYQKQKITTSCTCGNDPCPTTVGTNDKYEYCYNVCRKYPACNDDSTNPITASCVCSQDTKPGDVDCTLPEAGKFKYCYTKDSKRSCYDTAAAK